jgi:hypothetical protein
MTGEVVAARVHPAVVVAAIAVTACALVAIAYLLGWVPSKPAMPAPMSVALPGSQVAGSAPDIALLPGESLVDPAPMALAPPAAPASRPEAAAVPKPSPAPAAPYAPPPSRSGSSAPTYAPSDPAPRPAPRKPAYSRAEPPPVTSYDRAAKTLCINCGSVASIGNASGDWEVRVRFEDGSSETLRYPERPRVRVGDKVYVEDGRLIPE